MSVRLILDTSALLAYAAADMRSVELGELIASVEENGDITGIPALCLVAAYKQVGVEDRSKLLELAGDDDGPTLILPLLTTEVAQVADFALQIDDDHAHAVVERNKHDATLGTYLRKAYAKTLDEYDILDL